MALIVMLFRELRRAGLRGINIRASRCCEDMADLTAFVVMCVCAGIWR
jgi:hypothetical protein